MEHTVFRLRFCDKTSSNNFESPYPYLMKLNSTDLSNVNLKGLLMGSSLSLLAKGLAPTKKKLE